MTAQPNRDQLRALADAATPGPWVVKTCEPCAKHGREDIQIWDERGHIPIAQWMDEVDPDAGDDAAFIAAARTAIPQLLDQLDQQEAELDSWMARAYEAEGKLWKAEARIKAVRDLCDDYAHTAIWGDKERIATSDIRRALESDPPPAA